MTTTDPSVSIFDSLDQLGSLDLDGISFQGTNLRLIAGQRSTFPIEDRMGFVKIPENGLAMTRLAVSDQSGKLVIRGECILMGETIGLLGDNDEETPLPVYSAAQFSQWRTYGHAIRWEFQNPRPETVAALVEMAQRHGWITFVPTTRSDRPAYERAAGVQVLHDLTAANGNSAERFRKGIQLDSCVIVPDLRIAANLTEYINSDGDTVQRPAFTSFIDSFVPLYSAALAAGAGTDNEAKRESLNRLSTLTGYNAENDWPNRPSLGYLTPKGGEELTVFPDRDAMPTSGQDAAEQVVAQSVNPTPEAQAQVPVSEKPFEQ